MDRQIHLFVDAMLPRQNACAWRLPAPDGDIPGTLEGFMANVRLAEKGKFDAVFITDILTFFSPDTWAYRTTDDFEPFSLAGYVAASTQKLGIVMTASTTFEEPYNLARQLLSADHLSKGRVGWNIVTTWSDTAAANFGRNEPPKHADRYRQGGDSVEAVLKLWDCWEETTIVADKESGVYNDVSKIHLANHEGEYFRVKGPLGAKRSIQGHPVVLQAGSSPTGIAFAAKYAEVVFTMQASLDYFKMFRERLFNAAQAEGRARMPLVAAQITYTLGATDEEARATAENIANLIVPEYQLAWLRDFGVELGGAPLDGPVPPIAPAESSNQTQSALTHFQRVADQCTTVRQFLAKTALWGLNITGTPERLADELQRWFDAGADAFMLAPWAPGQLRLFVEHVVPILQERGIYRRDYEGSTFRDHLGLAKPLSRYADMPQDLRSATNRPKEELGI